MFSKGDIENDIKKFYRTGNIEGLEQLYKTASKELHYAIEFVLGMCYYEKGKVEEDLKEAQSQFTNAEPWFKKADENGHKTACFYLGCILLYYQPEPGKLDVLKQAKKYFEKALSQGYEPAQSENQQVERKLKFLENPQNELVICSNEINKLNKQCEILDEKNATLRDELYKLRLNRRSSKELQELYDSFTTELDKRCNESSQRYLVNIIAQQNQIEVYNDKQIEELAVNIQKLETKLADGRKELSDLEKKEQNPKNLSNSGETASHDEQSECEQLQKLKNEREKLKVEQDSLQKSITEYEKRSEQLAKLKEELRDLRVKELTNKCNRYYKQAEKQRRKAIEAEEEARIKTENAKILAEELNRLEADCKQYMVELTKAGLSPLVRAIEKKSKKNVNKAIDEGWPAYIEDSADCLLLELLLKYRLSDKLRVKLAEKTQYYKETSEILSNIIKEGYKVSEEQLITAKLYLQIALNKQRDWLDESGGVENMKEKIKPAFYKKNPNKIRCFPSEPECGIDLEELGNLLQINNLLQNGVMKCNSI